MEDTLFKNLFDVKTGGGCTSTGPRKGWETSIFGPCYDNACDDENDSPSKRPKYGVLDVCNDPQGVLPARCYGRSYFVFRNVRLRTTFASCDTSAMPDLAVLDQHAKVLYEYFENELREVVRVATAPPGSEERVGDSGAIIRYKEAQIHGEVQLARDIVRLVAVEEHRDMEKSDGHFGKKEVEELCEKHGWELVWQDQERERRIKESRGADKRHVVGKADRKEPGASFKYAENLWKSMWTFK